MRSFLIITILFSFIQPLVADEPLFNHVIWTYEFIINTPVSEQTYREYSYPREHQEQSEIPPTRYEGRYIVYYEDGRRIKEVYFNRHYEQIGLANYVYENGLLIEHEYSLIEHEFSYEDTLYHTFYYYDDENRLDKSEEIIEGITYYYQYDEKNRCVERRAYYDYDGETHAGGYQIYEFDETSRLIAWHQYSYNDELSYSSFLTYNQDGLLTSIDQWDGFYRNEYYYNETSNLSEIHFYQQGTHQSIEYVTYEE